jgi:hypothetical protein
MSNSDYNGFHEDFGDSPSVEEVYNCDNYDNPENKLNWDELNQWDE